MTAVARPSVIVANAKPPVQRKPKGPERKWTGREDEILINAVGKYTAGEKINWIKIAELIDGRSNKACRKRWIHSLNPTLRKGRWTIQEDELLLKAIRKHGHCWHKVAKYLPGRTDDQAAKRFREKLDPGIAKTPWSEEEDRVLLDMWKKVGCRWNLISRELNGRPAVHCRNRFASLKRIQKSLDPEGQSETSPGSAHMDPTDTPNLSTSSLSPHSSPCSTPPRQPSPCALFPDGGDADFASNMGFSEHADGHELQQIQEINSLLVGGERGPSHSNMPGISSTLYQLRLNEARQQSLHRGSAPLVKLSFADHPDMRVLSSGQVNPHRRASAPQLGFPMSGGTSQTVPRQLPYLYSCMYSDCSFGSNHSSDIAQHLAVSHQRPDAICAFDIPSSFSSFADLSPSRPTSSDSEFSGGSADSVFGFSSGSTSPSVSPADELRFGLYQDANLVKLESAAAGVDLVGGWNNSGFFGLDAMGGFDTFGNVPLC